MSLIIEDGTGSNPSANSYQDIDDLRTYASLRGIALDSKDNDECRVLLIKAMDYIEAKNRQFKGERVSSSQPLSWPRSDVWDVEIAGALMPSNEIPRLLQQAQLALAIEALDNDLQPNASTTGQITKEKVGNIEVTYSSDSISQPFVSAFAKADAMLSPLMNHNGLSLVRT